MTIRTKHLMMFSASLAVTVLAAAALMTDGNAGPSHRHHYGDDGMLIAHEWGTFTSVQGSDGVILDGLQHEQEHLPDFVHAVTTRTASPFRDLGDPSSVVPVRRTRGKMETPVIYFYTDRARRVRVNVSYTRGLLSHFYPAPVQTTGIDESTDELDLSRVVSTSAEWKLDVIPPRDADPTLPAVEAGNLYGHARDVSAAYVESGDERERFIFYRGLGHNPPKVTVQSADAWARLTNRTGGRIPAAFALEMTETDARFVALDAIASGASRDFVVDRETLRDKHEVIRDLQREVERALVAEGLYGDEAAAMVKTWSESWFGDAGTRVLYLVPAEATERLLPLEISPKPDKLVRVLVGRVEYMTPAQERTTLAALTDAASGDETTAARGMRELASLGRFLEPKLRRAMAVASDEAAKAKAREILAQL